MNKCILLDYRENIERLQPYERYIYFTCYSTLECVWMQKFFLANKKNKEMILEKMQSFFSTYAQKLYRTGDPRTEVRIEPRAGCIVASLTGSVSQLVRVTKRVQHFSTRAWFIHEATGQKPGFCGIKIPDPGFWISVSCVNRCGHTCQFIVKVVSDRNFKQINCPDSVVPLPGSCWTKVLRMVTWWRRGHQPAQ